MSSPVGVNCPLSPGSGSRDQTTKTFSKDSFKTSLLGTTAFKIQNRVEEEETEDNGDISTETEGGDNNSNATAPSEPKETGDTNVSPVTSSCETPCMSHKTNDSVRASRCSNDNSKVSTPNDFDTFEFAFGNGGNSGAILEDAFSDNVLISSPAPTPSDGKVLNEEDMNEEKMRSTIQFLIEMDPENINLSTKSFMSEIANHLGIDTLPKKWKGVIKSLLVEEATSYTQSQTDNSHSFPNVNSVEDTDDKQPLPSPHFEESDDGSDDDYAAANSSVDQRRVKREEVKEKSSKDNEKNEELLVQEKLDAGLSERAARMLEYIERDEEEIDSKAEALRQKLQERKKQRTLQKIAEASAESSKKARELKLLTKRLVEEGEYSHASRVVKDAINVNMPEVDEISEDDDDDDDSDGDMIALSDDEDDDYDEVEKGNCNSDDVVETYGSDKERSGKSVNKSATIVSKEPSSTRINPFLRGGRGCKKATIVHANKKWCEEKEKFRRRANEKAIYFQAKEVGCESVEVFNTILDVVEINRRRDVALKQEQKLKQEEQMRAEEDARLDRERKFRESMLQVDDDDSDRELDDDVEISKAVKIDTVVGNSLQGEFDVDIDALSSDDDEEENEEERQARALREEEAMLEKLKRQEEEEEKMKNADAVQTENVSSTVSNLEDSGKAEDNLIDSDVEESVSIRHTESEVDKKKKKKESKGLSYVEMIRLEEQQARLQQKVGSGFLDDEAEEEEEEEGGQAGLGDFGFTFAKTEQDEEREALKLHKGDLSHIVDDEDAESGDEEEGRRRRIEDEEREEKQRMKDIVSGLAKGHSGRKEDAMKRNAGGLYGQDDLAQEGIYATERQEEKEMDGDTLLNDDDDERAMAEMLDQMKSRVRQQGQEYDAEDLTDDSEDEDEDEAAVSEMTQEERLLRLQQKQQQKKQESDNYKRFYDQALRNRALRREKQKAEADKSGTKTSPSSLPLLSLTSLMPLDESTQSMILPDLPFQSSGQSVGSISRSTTSSSTVSSVSVTGDELQGSSNIKRRTSLPPRKMDSAQIRQRAPKRHRSQSAVGGGAGVAEIGVNKKSPRGGGSAEVHVSGVLDKSQLDAGYGLGMCISDGRRRELLESNSRTEPVTTATANKKAANCQHGGSSTSLFAAVTAKKSSEQPGLTRSFSGVLARSKSMSNAASRGHMADNRGLVTVASQQFVFKEESQASQFPEFDVSNSAWGGEASRHGEDSRSHVSGVGAGRKRRGSSSGESSATLKRAKTVGSLSNMGNDESQSDTSIFSQLSKSVGPIRASSSLGRGSSTTHRFRPSASVRSKLASFTNSVVVKK